MKHPYKFIWFTNLLFFFLSLSAMAQEICFNGIDDDGDGLIDCADGNCAAHPYCQREGDDGTGNYINCNDGIDNDGDGLADCQDSDCAASTIVCPIESDCGNGIDDDNDGFIDYYDGDCLADPNNPNKYIITKPDCEAVPVGNVFEIEPAWDSDVLTSAAMGMPSVADLDQDGYPEVITINTETGWMFILDGRTGNTINQVRIQNGGVFAYPAVADVDGDGFGEIFTISQNGRIRAYEHDLTLKWQQTSIFTGHGRQLALADFNGDGRAELYYGNEIRDAATGQLLVRGSHGSSMYPSANNWQTQLNAVPVAVDILPSPGLELVLGHIIYTVNITNAGGTAGNSLTEAFNMNNASAKPVDFLGYYPADADWTNQIYSQTAVVDYNQDGSLDVIMGGANGNIDGPTTAFFWDLANDEVKMFFVTRPGNTIPGGIRGTFEDMNGNACDNGDDCYWERGMGNINIADIDNDGQVEATFMSGSSLYALETDFTLKWANHDDFWESSSGVTGTTVFDFDGDGSSEIVYRDEVNLYIVDGLTGEPLNFTFSTFCSSQTQADYPIVADVDGDGETEIIVSCGEAENIKGQGTATGTTRDRGFIRAYKAAGGNYWVPSRALWNQTNYFNVNINDNLTVPRVQQPHHLSFSQICNDPSVTPPFALNKFLNQSPRISYCGQLAFPAPKLDFVDDGVIINPPVCPDNQFRVRLIFQNTGDEMIVKPIPVSFYADNPTLSYSNADESPYLETVDINVTGGVQIGQKIDTTILVNAARGEFDLYVSLNDIGQYDSLGAPLKNEDFFPLYKLNGSVRECDDTPTIVSKRVYPLPFDVQAVVIRDNRNCPGSSSNNGEVQVLAADGSPLPSSSYSFSWTNIHTGLVVGTNALVTSLDSGTYRVEVVNTDYNCTGNADTVTVIRFEEWPDTEVVTVEELQPVSSCMPGTADGVARVLINGSAVDETNYDIIWEDEQQPGTLALGDTATNLKPIRYKVTVTNKLTGCLEIATIDMTLDMPDMAAPVVNNNTNCKNPNGNINAQLNTGNKSDYEFILIQHSPVQDTITSHNNGSFTKLDEGVYELKAYNKTTFCGLYSNGIMVELSTNKSVDDIQIQVAQEQSACAPPYDGQLTADISSINPNQYDWVWYRGTVTTGPTAEIVATDYITPDTLSTNTTDIYTVVATQSSSGCSFTGQIQLTENLASPEVSATNINVLSNQMKCTPDGRVQITVGTGNETAGYVFSLTRGSNIVASNETGLFTGLEAGTYSVEVQNKATQCISENVPDFDILLQIPAFGPVTTNTTHVSSCDPSSPNGSVVLDVQGTTVGYTFQWFEGTDTTIPLSPQPATPYQLLNAAADDYTVLIANPGTGCDTTVYIRVLDQSALFQDTIEIVSVSPQNNCDPNPKNGSITAGLIKSANGPAPDLSKYTFTWYVGSKQDVINNAAAVIPGENGPSISGIDAGVYSVTAVRDDGCQALGIAEVEVEDHRNYPKPDINIKIVEQSSCDSDNPNGWLEANVGNTVSGFTFNWYRNNGSGSLDPVALNTARADNLPTGNYILEVINNTTNCSADTTIFLDDNIAVGSEIELIINASPVTGCDPNNGELEVTDVVVKGNSTSGQRDYTYDWYRIIEPGVDSILVASNTGPRLTQLAEGDYSVIATNDTTSCNSVAWPVSITRDPTLDISFSFDDTEQSSCSPPDGGLEVLFPVGVDPDDYTYQWYLGEDTTFYRMDGYTTRLLEDVRAETYTVAVTSKATNCTTLGSWSVPPGANLLPIPDPNVVITPSNSCAPFNGSISAEVDNNILTTGDYATNGYTQNDFYFYWFEGTKILRENVNPDFDHPDNYKPLFEPTAGNNRSTIAGLKPGKYTVIIVDVKDGVDSYKCRSTAKHTYVVPGEAFIPDVVNVVTEDNVMCGPTGDGFVRVEVNKKATDVTANDGYDFYWFNDDEVGVIGTPTETITTAPYISNYTNLSGGDYTVYIVDKRTGCDTTITRRIFNKGIPPEIIGTSVVAQRDCSTEFGRIEVTALSNGYAISDHDFYWYDSEADLAADVPYKIGNTGTPSDWELTGLTTGNYWVVARSKSTNCISTPEKVFVPDQRHYPKVQLDSKLPYTRCDGVGDGALTVTITDNPSPTSNFKIEWTSTVAGFTTVTVPNVTTHTLTNLLPGRYNFTVTNNDTQCQYSGFYEVEARPLKPLLLANAHDITQITTCQYGGEITINKIEYNNAEVNVPDTDFTFEWRYGTNDAAGITAFNNLGVIESPSGNNVSNLPEGDYYVWVRHSNGCLSDRSKRFEIREELKYPQINRNFIVEDILCDGNPDGEIEVRANEDLAPLPVNGYTFTWFDVDGNQLHQDDGVTTSHLTGLEAGTYTVEVLNKDTQCRTTANYQVNGKVVLPVLVVSKLADQSYCIGNGEAEVSAVNFRGSPLNLNDFRFFWYENNPTSASFTAPQNGLSPNSLAADSLIASTYFVIAENRVSGCRTLPVQVNIEDISTPLVVVLDDISEPITACDPTNFPEGEIEIDVRNSNNIVTSWYEGYSITNLADSIAGFNNSLEIENLIPGAYTVWVMDTLTGCSTTRTYTIGGIEVPIVVSTSSKNFSSCIRPDGMIAAKVNGGSGEYIYTWYFNNESGSTQLNVPDNANYVEGLTNGDYTVVVQDRREPNCEDAISRIEVIDSRGEDIMLTVSTDFQMTNCDENKPNGQLSVDVNGDLSRYSFFWYEGTNIDNQPIASGPVLSKLSAGEYSVIARDKVSGCISDAFTGQVLSEPSSIVIPTPVVSTSPVTRCDQPNGSAIATLDSTLVDPDVDYIYTWFNEEGNEVFSSARKNEVNFLPAGNYSVMVTNSLSGCVSSSTEFSIGEEIYTHEFEILSTPSTCLESNGTIMIDFVEPIKVVEIEWVTPEGYASGFFLSNQPPGYYEVSITDDKGCVHTKSGVIMSSVHAFNGVSPNGDGKNDRFIISCIEQYNENIVRIYNRTGALVYEDFHYDNQSVYFEGRGNRGIYIGGEDLPEGTYFYIIDKNDGEEPESGFLELLR